MESSRLGKVLVTGGAGFIGSHVVDRLVANGEEVIVLDNLSSGFTSNISKHTENEKFNFINVHLGDSQTLKESLKDIKTIFHLAAYPEVRTGFEHPEISFQENIQNTFNLLEEIRKSNTDTILFTSSSTIYGEPKIIPTLEDYGPLFPISPYGASKLACESLISSYCYAYGIRGIVFRLANIVGSRSHHGIILDFIEKLKADKKKLEVLGDGKQTKSYLHVSDCIDSFFFCLSKIKKTFDVFNIGNDDRIDVISIANIVCKNMKLEDVKIMVTGGVDGGRGWIGDVKKMHLDISKLKNLGWRPNYSSYEVVDLASKEIIREGLLNAIDY